MGKFGKFAGVAAIALGASVCAMPAQAAVNLELGLGIDASSSMSSSQFNLQRNAYYNVLADPGLIPLDGTVAIGVYRFASTVTQIYPITVLNNLTDLNNLRAAILAMGQSGDGSLTNLGGVINEITDDLLGNSITSARQLIDISTDGDATTGPNLNGARTAAVAAGIDAINCIGIGNGANCAAVQGSTASSFSMQADSFDDFEDALRAKIVREVHGAVPEPTTWALMIGGFALVGLSMRRRKVKVSFA